MLWANSQSLKHERYSPTDFKKGSWMNWDFDANSNFRIPISLQSDIVNLLYFKLRLFGLYQRSTTLGSKNIEIWKSEFVAWGDKSFPLTYMT